MSDENKELRSLGGGSDEALSRAERIKAIKYSIRKQSGQTAEPADVPEIKPAEDVQSEVQPKSEADAWESELAERIAKRVNKVKTDKKSEKEKKKWKEGGQERYWIKMYFSLFYCYAGDQTCATAMTMLNS